MKLLITGAYAYTNQQIEYIKSMGHNVYFIKDEREKVEFDISQIEGVICNSLFLYNDIKAFTSLKYIQLISAGLDRVPLEYIRKNNIVLNNARGVYSIPMAEFVIRGVLDLYKKSFEFYDNQKEHLWTKIRNIPELYNKTVLIIGAGNIGTEVAKRFKAFGTNVVGVDIDAKINEYFDRIESIDKLNAELKESDIVVLTLPLTEKNIGFFDKSKFDNMRKNAIIVNISRGKLIKESDLICALKNKTIYGGVIDVFESEPVDDKNELWNLDNVILTPHNSFVSENNSKRMFDVIVDNLKKYGM